MKATEWVLQRYHVATWQATGEYFGLNSRERSKNQDKHNRCESQVDG